MNAQDYLRTATRIIVLAGMTCAPITLYAVPGGLAALEERVAALEAVIGGPPTTEFDVDCAGGDTISAALQAATPAVPILIRVQGLCPEDVTIERDDVTIKGVNPGPVDGIIGGITVLGGSRINLTNLVIRDGSGIGVLGLKNSSLMLTHLSISGHAEAGIFLTQNSSAVIDSTDVSNPPAGLNALGLSDGADARITDSSFISENGIFDDGAAIGLFRSAHVRLDGDNTITNTNVSSNPNEALAIQVIGTSSVRIQNGANVITGNLIATGDSNIDLRAVTMTGRTDVQSHSRVIVSRGTLINGNVVLVTDSLLEGLFFGPPSTVTGAVTCSNRQSLVNTAGLTVGTITSCTME